MEEKKISVVDKVKTDTARAMKEKRLKEMEKTYEDNRQKAIDRYISNVKEYGNDSYVTTLSKTSVMMIYQLDEAFKMIVELNRTLTEIDTVFELMDETMSCMEEIITSPSKINYNLKTRWQMRKEQRRYVRNIKNRFKALDDKIYFIQSTSNTIMKSTSSLSKSVMKGNFNLNKAATKKKDKNTGAPIQAEFLNEKIQADIDKRRGELGVAAPVSTEDTSKNWTDISDITD